MQFSSFLKLMIRCSFENLAFSHFTFSVHQFGENFLNEQQIMALKSLFSSFVGADGSVIVEEKRIRKNYLKSGFLIGKKSKGFLSWPSVSSAEGPSVIPSWPSVRSIEGPSVALPGLRYPNLNLSQKSNVL